MIKEIFENLFKPVSDDELGDRQADLVDALHKQVTAMADYKNKTHDYQYGSMYEMDSAFTLLYRADYFSEEDYEEYSDYRNIVEESDSSWDDWMAAVEFAKYLKKVMDEHD